MVQRAKSPSRFSLAHYLYEQNFRWMTDDKKAVNVAIEKLRKKYLRFPIPRDYENNKDIIDMSMMSFANDYNVYLYGLNAKAKYCGNGILSVNEVQQDFFQMLPLKLYVVRSGRVISEFGGNLSDLIVKKSEIIGGTEGEIQEIVRQMSSSHSHSKLCLN